MFVTAQDFKKTPYKIPNLDDAEIGADFQNFVNEKEEGILSEILGPNLYAELTAGLLDDPILEKWIRLRDGYTTTYQDRKYKWVGFVTLLKPIIFAMWLSEKNTTVVGEGEVVVVDNESSTQVVSDQKIIDAYNRFVDLVGYAFSYRYGNDLYTFLELNELDYPSLEYANGYHTPFGFFTGLDKMNFLDL